MNQRKI